MSTLTDFDVSRVVRNLPADVRKLLRENKDVCLGGGFIRAIVCGEKPSDIDLFGNSAIFLDQCAENLFSERGRQGKIFHSENAITLNTPPRAPVQFITRWLFDHPTKTLESFDFTICKAVLWYEDKDWKSAAHPDFYSDLAARRLVYTYPDRNEDAGGSIMRVRKFLMRGYNIQAASFAGTIARLMKDITPERIEKDDRLTGGTYEEKLATVITAKLREVDPLTIIDNVDIDEGGVL